MIHNLPPRQRWLSIAAGTLVALFVLDAVLFTPLTKMWKEHSAEIVRLQKQVTDGRALIARGTQLERTWADMQAHALPKDPAQAEQDVISAFDRWRIANNIEFTSQRPQWKRGTSDRHSLMEYRVDATGNLSALTRFLYELEASPLALRIDSMDLTARDESGSRLTLGLVITGLRLSKLER